MASDFYLSIWTRWNTQIQRTTSTGKPMSILRVKAEKNRALPSFLVVCSCCLFSTCLDCFIIFAPTRHERVVVFIKEARNSFFGLGVYLLKSKFRIEDKLRFPWYYTTFSINDQSLFSHWFPSNSCYHSNGNGQPLISNNVKYLEN